MWSGVTSAGFSQEKVPSQGVEISPVTKIALEVMALLQKTSSPLAEIKKKILLDPALTLVVVRGAYGENHEGNAHLTLTEAMEKLGFSARSYSRILKVARTIADLTGAKAIQEPHLAEAIQYRSLDRKVSHA